MKKLTFLFSCLLFTFSCSQNPKTIGDLKEEEAKTEVKEKSPEEIKRAALRKQVMDVHDDAMAKMSQLYDLEINLKNTVDSLDKPELEKTKTTISALQKANKDMMAWMGQYKDPKPEVEMDSVEKYFAEQMILIKEVKHLTDSSIAQANQLLEEWREE